MKRLFLSLVLAAVAFVAAFGVVPAPVADAYPPRRPPIIITPPGVGPGDNVDVTVGNCEAGERVVIIFNGERRIVICNPGVLSATATFTAPMEPGTYEICAELTGEGADLPPGVTRPEVICTTIQVSADLTPAPPAAAEGDLAATGSSGIGTTATSAIVLIAAGTLLLLVTRVRRRRTSAAASA